MVWGIGEWLRRREKDGEGTSLKVRISAKLHE